LDDSYFYELQQEEGVSKQKLAPADFDASDITPKKISREIEDSTVQIVRLKGGSEKSDGSYSVIAGMKKKKKKKKASVIA